MRLLKKTVLAVATLVLALAAFVAPTNNTKVEAADGINLYLTPNSNWKIDNARFAIYTWDGGDQWFDMADTDGDGVYEATIPTGIKNIIFCRMNPSTSANNWNNKWNQTSDLQYTGEYNHYTVKDGTWDKGGGTWSVFESDEPGIEETPTLPELPAGVETFPVYFSNPDSWTEVYAYTWDSTGTNYQGTWPGTKISVDATTGYYMLDKAFAGESIIFNDGSSNQTDDLTVQNAEHCLWNGTAWSTLSGDVVEPEQPEEPEVGNLVLGVVGTFNGWGSDIFMAYNDELSRYEATVEFNENDEWKIRQDEAWTTSYGWHYENNHSSVDVYCDNPENDGNIKVSVAGKYLVWIDNNMSIGMEPVVEPWELEVKVGYQVGTKDEAKALRLVAEFNLDAEKLETFESTVQFRVTKGSVADTRDVTTLYSSVNPMNDEAELTGAYYAVLTYVNIPAGEYTVEVLVDGEVAATVVATVA